MEIWEPKTAGNLWATPDLLRDSFTFYMYVQTVLKCKFHSIGKKIDPFLYFYQCIFFGGQHKEHWQAMLLFIAVDKQSFKMVIYAFIPGTSEFKWVWFGGGSFRNTRCYLI